MRIAIYGLGAVGGYIGAKLAAAGHDVSAVARGATLAAVRQNGLVLERANGTLRQRITASDRPADLGPHDLVITTLKATHPAALADNLVPMLGPQTPVVFAQNGIPWWYGIGLSPTRPKPPALDHLDPGGRLKSLAGGRVIGAVIMFASEMSEPGVARDTNPKTSALLVGEPDDSRSARIQSLRQMLDAAGIASPDVPDIRQAIWRKLMINMTASMLATLTGRKLAVVPADPRLRRLYLRAAREAVAIATAHGIDLASFNAEAWLSAAPEHTPSISVDFQRSRPMEIDVMLETPLDFARSAGVDTPTLDAIAGLLTRQAIDKGLYAERAST